jgi:cell shape-determining protein MreC
MTDIVREKFRRLMAEIDVLEGRVDGLTQEVQAFERSGGNEQETAALRQELHDLMEKLASNRNELARLSDGCGHPHSQI